MKSIYNDPQNEILMKPNCLLALATGRTLIQNMSIGFKFAVDFVLGFHNFHHG